MWHTMVVYPFMCLTWLKIICAFCRSPTSCMHLTKSTMPQASLYKNTYLATRIMSSIAFLHVPTWIGWACTSKWMGGQKRVSSFVDNIITHAFACLDTKWHKMGVDPSCHSKRLHFENQIKQTSHKCYFHNTSGPNICYFGYPIQNHI